MTIKELVQQLNKYDENLEVVITIDDKQEDRLEINKSNDKVYITKDSKIRIDELQNEIKRMKFENALYYINNLMNRNYNYFNYNFNETWDERMKRLGSRMNGYKED